MADAIVGILPPKRPIASDADFERRLLEMLCANHAGGMVFRRSAPIPRDARSAIGRLRMRGLLAFDSFIPSNRERRTGETPPAPPTTSVSELTFPVISGELVLSAGSENEGEATPAHSPERKDAFKEGKAARFQKALAKVKAKEPRLPSPRHLDIDDGAWQILKYDYLRPERPSWSSCYRRMVDNYAKPRGLAVPHPTTLFRKLKREVRDDLIIAGRRADDALLPKRQPTMVERLAFRQRIKDMAPPERAAVASKPVPISKPANGTARKGYIENYVERLEKAKAFLRAKSYTISQLDPKAPIPSYFVSGYRGAFTNEHLVAFALHLGMDEVPANPLQSTTSERK